MRGMPSIEIAKRSIAISFAAQPAACARSIAAAGNGCIIHRLGSPDGPARAYHIRNDSNRIAVPSRIRAGIDRAVDHADGAQADLDWVLVGKAA